MKKYPILNLTKDDLYQLAEDLENEEEQKKMIKKIDGLKDNQMKYLANRLGELYCETYYWNTLLDLVRGLR